MKLTLFINPEHPPGADLARALAEHVEQVRLARELGYDGIAIGHHLSYGPAAWFPPSETLARLAPEADGMGLATCMLLLPLLHPLHVAEQAAFLDVASGGRMTLGIAPGWQEDESTILGLDHRRRLGRFLEGHEIIRRLWTEAAVDFEGRNHRLVGASLALKPARRPRPPFWFGGSVAAAVERAAALSEPELGDSWIASSHLTQATIVEQAALYRSALEAAGKPFPADFPVLRNIVVGPDRETAIREAAPFLEASYKIFGDWGLFTKVVGAGKAQLDLGELLEGRVVIGSPEDCAAELAALAEATGATRLIARVQWLGMDQRLVLRTIELLAGRVVPLLAA